MKVNNSKELDEMLTSAYLRGHRNGRNDLVMELLSDLNYELMDDPVTIKDIRRIIKGKLRA